MGFLNAPITPAPKPWREDPLGRALGFVVLAVFGLLLGIQYWTPNKRIIPVVAVMLVFGVAWRLSMAAAVNVLVFLLPYPKGTVFGSTNLAFIMIMFVIWLLRLSLRTAAPARSSPLNLPILGMLLWAVLSFYNVRTDFALERALQNFESFVACVVLYYLIVNCVRTQADLERLHTAQMVTALGVFFVATWELHNPGRILIPGLLDFSGTLGNDFNTRNVRVGASFRDYELLSEYCGLMFLFTLFQLMRARSQTRRALLGLFCLFNVYTLFTTVTRGVIVSLVAALPYVFFVVRRRMNPVRFVAAVSVILMLGIGMNFLVAHYTNSGNMFERLGETRVVHGIVPEARAAPWTNAWKRALVHPILGQGPYYDELPGYEYWWPHNVYLFIANLYGFPGLGFYLMLLGGLVMLLRPVVDDLQHESYADAYLIVARAQLFLFMLNELKIDYLRNAIYQFQVWQFFGMWTAAYLVSREHGVRAGFHVAEPHEPPGKRLAA
jgi:O-antigen ligase